MIFMQKTRTNQLRVGMICKYIGNSRPMGTLGILSRINKDSTVVIDWRLSNGDVHQQVYKANPETSYVWGTVLFADQSQQQETKQMQTVTLLTIGKLLTLEITDAQAKLIRESSEGQVLTANDTLVVTKAIKQDGQYFALNPLQVTLPKSSTEIPSGFGGPQSLSGT